MQTLATTLTESEAEAAIVGGIAGATIGMFVVVLLIFYVLLVIAGWKILKKAGEPGWKILIPIYNIYMLLKIVNMKNWFWWLLLISICTSIMINIDMPQLYNMSPDGYSQVDWGKHPTALIALIIDSVATLAAAVVYSWRTSKAFGHGVPFAIGLFLLPNLFWLILGFGSSKYSKKALKK